MYEFDTKRIKFLSMLIVLLLTFSLFVSNAYKYIPEQKNTVSYGEENKVSEIDDYLNKEQIDVNESQPEAVGIEQKNEQVTAENTDSFKQALLETLNLEEEEKIIPIETLAKQKTEEKSSENMFSKVKDLKNQQNYQEAIAELKSILETSNDPVIKSNCYEEMAFIYGIDKHYGTALAYAQKAYNLYPTTNREVLLARLYYKTGDTERATNRINNVLKRDFWADR